MTRHELEDYATLWNKENSLRLRIQRLVEVAEDLKACVNAVQAQRERVRAWVDRLPPAQRAVMHARYIEGLDWHVVAREAGYSRSQCHRLHDKALQEMNA